MEIPEATDAKKNISDDHLRKTGEIEYHIPFDLIPKVFSDLPVKALARFLCVSTDTATIIRNRDFVKSYLIKSSARPSELFFTFKSKDLGYHFFFSASHPEKIGSSSSSSSSSSSCVATYHMKCHSYPYPTISPSVHGLICYGPPSKLMVYNPSTRRTITLPKFMSYAMIRQSYIGYDPVNGDYKVLCVSASWDVAQECRVLTLGDGNAWREIQDIPTHYLSYSSPDACVDGVLYYQAYLEKNRKYGVVSFDVRTEKFDLIKAPRGGMLTTFEGKLAVLFSGSSKGSICLCVLEDAAKHEWSKRVYVLPVDVYFDQPFCATHEGEIVLAHRTTRGNLLYYDPKRNSVRRVYMEGISHLKPSSWDAELSTIFSGQVDNLLFL